MWVHCENFKSNLTCFHWRVQCQPNHIPHSIILEGNEPLTLISLGKQFNAISILAYENRSHLLDLHSLAPLRWPSASSSYRRRQWHLRWWNSTWWLWPPTLKCSWLWSEGKKRGRLKYLVWDKERMTSGYCQQIIVLGLIIAFIIVKYFTTQA